MIVCDSGHLFSIELNSKEYLKSLALPSESGGDVLIEGFLGDIRSLSFTEGIMLEIEGTNGVLRLDLSKEELEGLLPAVASLPGGLLK